MFPLLRRGEASPCLLFSSAEVARSFLPPELRPIPMPAVGVPTGSPLPVAFSMPRRV